MPQTSDNQVISDAFCIIHFDPFELLHSNSLSSYLPLESDGQITNDRCINFHTYPQHFFPTKMSTFAVSTHHQRHAVQPHITEIYTQMKTLILCNFCNTIISLRTCRTSTCNNISTACSATQLNAVTEIKENSDFCASEPSCFIQMSTIFI